MRRVQTSCLIEAPIHDAWLHMVGVQNYSAWNPFIVSVQCDGPSTTPSTLMRFEVRWHDGKKARSNERVVRAVPPAGDSHGETSALWEYDFVSPLSRFGLVRARRIQELFSRGPRQTLYRTEEVFTGALAAFVPYDKVQRGFEDQAAALKQIAESTPMR